MDAFHRYVPLATKRSAVGPVGLFDEAFDRERAL